MDDWELLERYRRERSHAEAQPAFAELVNRHVGLVFGVCRRRLRDVQLAEDVTQAVFALLAQRGPASRVATLAPWLVKTAHYACANAHRARAIRDRHEQSAAEERGRQMKQMANDPNNPRDAASSWDAVEQLLDEAMQSAVSEQDRQLLMLRYHHDRDLNEVGAALGIAPNTAAKRLSRAIERLRRFLSDRGTDLSSVAVAEMLVRVAHESAPAGLAANAAAIATGSAAAPLAVQQLIDGVAHMIYMIKLKLVAGTVAAIVLGGSGVVAVNQLMAQPPSAKKPAAQSPATQPAATAVTPSDKRPRKLIANSPKEALTMFAKAARDVDVDGMKSLVKIEDPKEEQLLLAACDFAGANAAFLAAVKEKFGEQAEQQLRKGMRTNMFEEFLGNIENNLHELKETIDGDHAVLREGDEPDPIKLVRHDGSWKLSATGITESWPEQQYVQVLASMQRGSEVFSELATDVTDGKFSSFEELIQALRQAFQQGR